MPDTTDSGRLSNFMRYYQTANNVLPGNFGGYFWLGAERRSVDTGYKWFWVVSGLPNRDLNSVTSSHCKLYLLFLMRSTYVVKSHNKMEWSSWHTGHRTQSSNFLTTHLNRAWQDQAGSFTSTLFCLQGPRFDVDQPVFSTVSRQCGGSLLEWEEWGTCECVANKRQRRRLRQCDCSM